MDPEDVLNRRCARYRVPPDAAARLLPLVRRALVASPKLRTRLFDLVDAALAVEAEGISRRREQEQCLSAVAARLHRWG